MSIDQSIYSLQIPLVANLPVGKNLQDHMMFPAMIHVNESISGSDWVYGFWSQLKYSLFRSGWYTIKHPALIIVVLLFNKIFLLLNSFIRMSHFLSTIFSKIMSIVSFNPFL